MVFMESLLKAIDICGGTQAGFAKLITENLPDTVTEPVTPQQVWNWLKRDKIVPAQYCPTIEKICGGMVRCEQLNSLADWAVIRDSEQQSEAPQQNEASSRRSTDKEHKTPPEKG